MDADIDSALQEHALREKASVNFLVNRVLRKFVEWDAYASRFGFITITVPELKRLMGFLSEQEIREHARWFGENLTREYVIFFFKRVDYDTVLRALKMLGADYGGHYQFDDHFDGRTHIIICKHGRGEKWSLFYEEAFRCSFRALLGKDVDIEKTDDQVTIRVDAVRREEMVLGPTLGPIRKESVESGVELTS